MTYTATISSKGQITLPASIRRSLNVRAGDRLKVVKRGNSIAITADTYNEELAALRIKLQAHLKKQGFTPEKLRQIAENYQNGDGFASHVIEKYGIKG